MPVPSHSWLGQLGPLSQVLDTCGSLTADGHFSPARRLEVGGQGASVVRFWGRLSPWLVEALPAVSSVWWPGVGGRPHSDLF